MSERVVGRFRIDARRPWVMGIVNLTPDSFSGDGRLAGAALKHAETQQTAGADILDIGAESSRPGAAPISAQEEIARLAPVLKEVVHWGIPISVDTSKPEVMRFALDAGADLINDITALQTPGALDAVTESACAICLMHMQGQPRTMQENPVYQDIVGEVRDFLMSRVQACEAAGISRDRLWLDPGFGFGKTLAHNTALFQGLADLQSLGFPILVGVSRKRMLGELTGQAVEERVLGSVVAAVLAAQQGASILRVHDVAATCEGLSIWSALSKQKES